MITDKNTIKTLCKSEYYDRFFNTMKEKSINELLEILNNTLKSNINVFDVEKENIKNIENLCHYEKYVLTNKLNYCECLWILNYVIQCKIWDYDL